MCGIFAYLNYLVEKDRKFIVDTLTSGLSRLEYRGYDSAGKFSKSHCWHTLARVHTLAKGKGRLIRSTRR